MRKRAPISVTSTPARTSCRAAIGDSRIAEVTDTTGSFRWKDCARSGVLRVDPVPGTEFIARYLRHIQPRRLRSILHYGFCFPAARAKREHVALHTGRPLILAEPSLRPPAERAQPLACPCCGGPMQGCCGRWPLSVSAGTRPRSRARAPASLARNVHAPKRLPSLLYILPSLFARAACGTLRRTQMPAISGEYHALCAVYRRKTASTGPHRPHGHPTRRSLRPPEPPATVTSATPDGGPRTQDA
jgi:hypothetical protein